MSDYRLPPARIATRLCVLPLFICLLFNATPLAAQATTEDHEGLDRQLSERVFDEAWSTIQKRYYDPTLHKQNWESLRGELRPLALQATTEAELYRVLRRLTGALGDSHTRVFRPGEGRDWRRVRTTHTGVTLAEIEGRLFVTGVDDSSAAKRDGVRRGDEVIQLDGQAWRERLQAKLDEAAGASTPRIRRLQAIRRLLDGEANTTVTLTLANRRGRKTIANLTRTLIEREAELRITPLGNKTYRVAFNLFTSETVAAFARALRGELKGAMALVIDLRTNGGGEAEAMIDLLGIFLPSHRSLGRFVDRRGQIASKLQTRSAMFSAPESGVRFSGSVALLTGTATASAAEIFTDALQQARRAAVVGARTCGCVLAIRRRHRLPDGGTLDVSELDYRTSDDRRLEGIGVAPNEEVAPTIADLISGRDAVLARSLEIIRAAPLVHMTSLLSPGFPSPPR